MIENIDLTKAPALAGVYLFVCNNEVIYVGSSKDLYQRMTGHRKNIKKGYSKISNNHSQCQKDLYQFLQTNQFTVEFQLTDDFRQKEQELIEKYNPRFNQKRAFTGLGKAKGREIEYNKDLYQKYKEDISNRHKHYNHQVCIYNGETLTLNCLSKRFERQGIPHPTLEAKKYLIPTA